MTEPLSDRIDKIFHKYMDGVDFTDHVAVRSGLDRLETDLNWAFQGTDMRIILNVDPDDPEKVILDAVPKVG